MRCYIQIISGEDRWRYWCKPGYGTTGKKKYAYQYTLPELKNLYLSKSYVRLIYIWPE